MYITCVYFMAQVDCELCVQEKSSKEKKKESQRSFLSLLDH
jgi:hypothetical protein